MKTQPLYEHAINYACYIVIFLWTAFSVNAQCPTIPDPTPSPICDASGYTFSDLSTDYATDTGDGIVWYDSDTGGNAYNPNELVTAGIYYIDNDSGNCTTPRASITIDIQVNGPPSGVSLDKFYCSNENATIQDYIDDTLTPYIPSSVAIYYDADLTNQANVSDVIANGIVTYYIIFIDGGLCRSQINLGKTIVSASPADPTPPLVQAFCSDTNSTVADLDPGTAGIFSWYDSLDGFGNPIPPALSSATVLVDGATYYVQVDELICDSNPVAVDVTIDIPVDAGISDNLQYCVDDVPSVADFNLYDELGGTPATVGTWSGPLTTSNGYLGTVNITTLTTPGGYTFTYTVPSNGACPQASSTILITIDDVPESGTALAPAQICEEDIATNSPLDLFTLLDGTQDTNGTWYIGADTSGSTTTNSVNLTGFTDGTYDYTYSVPDIGTCSDVDVTVQIIILPQPNTGIASSPTYCENDLAANSPLDLFGALTGEEAGGTWTDDDATGALSGSDVNLTGLTIGLYDFTYSITAANGCTNSTTVTITVEDAPESGTALAPAQICEEDIATNSPLDLFTLLDGTQDTNGTWYIGADTSGSTTTNSVNLTGFTDGTYDYTYSVPDIGTCSDVDVTVQIIILPQPNTGIASSPTYCENDLAANSPLDLFGALTGEEAGGTWTDDDATGALSGSDVNLTGLTIGLYDFTYSITAANGCTNSTTVTITIEDAPESGTVNTAATFCIADITAAQTYNLFDLLEGEDQTGTWLDDDSTGALSGNLVTIDGLSTGTYDFTFDVDAIGTCDDVLVTVSIIINDTPAPTAAASQEFCDSATVVDLSATGTTIQWYDELTGGTVLTGTVDLVDGETYYASQTDATTGCESSVRTLVTATIHQSPNSGNPNSTPIVDCNNNNNIDLFMGLDGSEDAGGVWQDTDGTGALTGNIFDATAVIPGTYQFTYDVAASAPCVDSSTIITVTIDGPLNAGTDNTLDICSNNGTTDLFTLLGGADTGGTWSPAMTSGTGVFDPLVDADGTYTYALTNGCGTTTSDVVVTVTQAPIAGTDTSVTICVIDGLTDLFPLLGGAHTGGTWSPALTSGTGEFDPTVDTAGTYTYTVAATSPCLTDATADVIVTIADTPAPVAISPNPEFCLVDNPTVADLDGNISSTGTLIWYTDAALTIVANPTDPLIHGEDYYGTQTNASGCESSGNTQVNVTINDVATPTLIDSSLELCINDDPTINDLTLNISEYSSTLNNVTWYDAASNGVPISDTTILTNQTTYFAALFDATTGCESSVRLEFTPDLTACGKLVLPDGFSPNGDGTNDTYDYNNLDILYPNFVMEIYNRYGTMVYKGNASSQRFDGKSNQSGSLGKGDLPVGVYFYIFNFNDGTNKPEQGRIYLSR